MDVNQKYEHVLPQWRDLAVRLEVDELRTRWIEACVRPAEGLTRYMLEVYMKDGGTLGEVLQALLDLECLDILEALKGRVAMFVQERKEITVAESGKPNPKLDPKFFSVLSTLAATLGKADPCADLMSKYSGGLKSCGAQMLEQERERETSIAMTITGSGSGAASCDPNPRAIASDWPQYKSDGGAIIDKVVSKDKSRSGELCRIMLLFSDDGVQFSQEAHDIVQGFEYQVKIKECFLTILYVPQCHMSRVSGLKLSA